MSRGLHHRTCTWCSSPHARPMIARKMLLVEVFVVETLPLVSKLGEGGRLGEAACTTSR